MLLSEMCALKRDNEEHNADVKQRKPGKASRDREVGMAIRDAAMARLATIKNGKVADTRAADAVPNEDGTKALETAKQKIQTRRTADSGDTPKKEEEIQQRPKRKLC